MCRNAQNTGIASASVARLTTVLSGVSLADANTRNIQIISRLIPELGRILREAIIPDMCTKTVGVGSKHGTDNNLVTTRPTRKPYFPSTCYIPYGFVPRALVLQCGGRRTLALPETL